MSDSLDKLARFASGKYRPMTFLQRGVHVPFMAPALAGARIRPGERGGKELILNDMAQGQGWYVIPWDSMPELCSPTLADYELWTALRKAEVLTPQSVRVTVRESARGGFAGRKAKEAAEKLREQEEKLATVANFNLLLRLIRKTETPGEEAVAVERDTPKNIELRAKRANTRTTKLLNLGPDDVATVLQELSSMLQAVGLGQASGDFHVRDVLNGLGVLNVEAPGCVTQSEEGQHAQRLVRDAVQLTQGCAEPLLGAAEAALDELPALVARWLRDREKVLAEFERLAWLLDGWGPIIALWRTRDERNPDPALMEMAALVPLIPQEVSDWLGRDLAFDPQQALKKFVHALEDWRTGSRLQMVARNERILADTL